MRAKHLSLLFAPVLMACATPHQNTPPPESPEADMCRASEYAPLIGRHRSEIPTDLPQPVRVACTSCAVTMDHNPARLNIFYDEDTGVVRQVRCG